MTDRSLFNLAAPLITARGSRLLSLSLCVAMLSACAVGPDYQRPQTAEAGAIQRGRRLAPGQPERCAGRAAPGGSCMAIGNSMA